MINDDYITEVVLKAKELNAKKVLVQLPDGLKTKTIQIMEEFEKKRIDAIALLEPCFGACDIPEEKARELKADLIVHFGHEKFFEPKTKTLFWPIKYEVKEKELKKTIKTIMEKTKELGEKKIGLCCSIQFADWLREIEKKLSKEGIRCFNKQGSKTIAEKGQVLGCNYSVMNNAKGINLVFYIGDGFFHPIGLALASKKKVFAINPFDNALREIDSEKFVRKRFGQIALAKNAKSFGILIGTKKGQNRIELAIALKKKIEEKGFKAFFFAMDLVKPEQLLGINVDCFINTACPRIIDDSSSFPKPVVSAAELKIVLGESKESDYALDQIFQ